MSLQGALQGAAVLALYVSLIALMLNGLWGARQRLHRLTREQRKQLYQQITMMQRVLFLYGLYSPPLVRVGAPEQLDAALTSLRQAFGNFTSEAKRLTPTMEVAMRELEQLEANVRDMGQREEELRRRIEILENTTPEAARAFGEMLRPSEKRQIVALIVTFLAGVAVTVTVGLF